MNIKYSLLFASCFLFLIGCQTPTSQKEEKNPPNILLIMGDDMGSFLWDKVNELSLDNWELFDMEKDRTEMNNIAREHPDLVKKMAIMWQIWGKRTGIVPRPSLK